MQHAFKFRSARILSLALLCGVLSACATTQRDSSSSGSQAAQQQAAPISEAGSTPASQTPSAPAATTATATKPAATSGAQSAATSPAAQESPQVSALNRDNEQLQRELAAQDAEINRLREEQLAESRRLEDLAAQRQREPESAPAAQESTARSPATAQAGTGTSSSASAASTDGASTASVSGAQPAAAPRPLERSVYFEYDQTLVDQSYDDMLLGHAAYLRANADLRVEVQGNCDERGSREYNLALGARRAEAVKRALELAGADGNRIKAVSYGAEKPVAFGKDEESYRLNRRADIVY